MGRGWCESQDGGKEGHKRMGFLLLWGRKEGTKIGSRFIFPWEGQKSFECAVQSYQTCIMIAVLRCTIAVRLENITN